MRKKPNSNARQALEEMKLEIANEFDAKITQDEKIDGTMVRNLVDRAEKEIVDLENNF